MFCTCSVRLAIEFAKWRIISSVPIGKGSRCPGGLDVVALVSATILVVFSISAAESIVSSSAKAEWASLAAGVGWCLRGRRTRGESVSTPALGSDRHWLRVVTFAETVGTLSSVKTAIWVDCHRFTGRGSTHGNNRSKTDHLGGVARAEAPGFRLGFSFEIEVADV